jgi:AcrR family transcriptional regulator
MSNRKQILLGEVLEYLLERGVSGLSLRPLAAALDTSPRMLMFHFGSKEGLLQDVMQEVNRRLQKKLNALATVAPTKRAAPLKLFWEWATRRDNLVYFRLLYEAQIVATLNPEEFSATMKQSALDWRGLALQSMSESLREQPLADLCIAVFDGLLLEFIVTGERRRLTSALDRFVTILRPHAERDINQTKTRESANRFGKQTGSV